MTRCGCRCRCHTTEGTPSWPGPCAGCCEPGDDCACGSVDVIWCDIKNTRVSVSECASSCAAPEHRPVCWMGKMYRDEPAGG